MKKGMIGGLLAHSLIATSLYAQQFEKTQEFLDDFVDKKPTKFLPDDININHKVIPKNHKKFVIEGEEIYALSEKRAIEKFKKLKQSEQDWEQYELNL